MGKWLYWDKINNVNVYDDSPDIISNRVIKSQIFSTEEKLNKFVKDSTDWIQVISIETVKVKVYTPFPLPKGGNFQYDDDNFKLWYWISVVEKEESNNFMKVKEIDKTYWFKEEPILIIENPFKEFNDIDAFLRSNGFKLEGFTTEVPDKNERCLTSWKRIWWKNERCSVSINECDDGKENYQITYDDGESTIFSKDIVIYWLIGFLTYYGLMTKNYVQLG